MKLSFRELSCLIASLVLAVCLPALSRTVFARNVNLSWTASTDSDLAGYKAYYGISSQNYSTSINVGKVTSYTLTGLNEGTYYFALTAYDTSGNESAYSNEASVTVHQAKAQPQVVISMTTRNPTWSGRIRAMAKSVSGSWMGAT